MTDVANTGRSVPGEQPGAGSQRAVTAQHAAIPIALTCAPLHRRRRSFGADLKFIFGEVIDASAVAWWLLAPDTPLLGRDPLSWRCGQKLDKRTQDATIDG